MPLRRLLLSFCLIACMASAPPSFAAEPSEEGYGGPGGVAQTDVIAGDPGRDGGNLPFTGGNLPFTGLDLGLIAGGGVLLLGFGMGIRRLSGPPPAQAGGSAHEPSTGSATPRGPR